LDARKDGWDAVINTARHTPSFAFANATPLLKGNCYINHPAVLFALLPLHRVEQFTF